MDELKAWLPSKRGLSEGALLAVIGLLWGKLRPEGWLTLAEMLPYLAFVGMGTFWLSAMRTRTSPPPTNDDGSDRDLTAIAIQAQRTRADLAEERLSRLLLDHEAALNRFQQAEASSREMAVRANTAESHHRQALEAVNVLQQEVAALRQDAKHDQPLVDWAQALLRSDEKVVEGRLSCVSSRASFRDIGLAVGAHFRVEVTFRYSGVIPIRIGEDLTGFLGFHHERFPHKPEGSAVYLDRGGTATLVIFQAIGKDSERVAIQNDLDLHGEAVVQGQNVRLSVRGERPDGTVVDEWVTLPYDISSKA